MTENEILQAISRYKFYHIIQLMDNIATPGNTNYFRFRQSRAASAAKEVFGVKLEVDLE